MTINYPKIIILNLIMSIIVYIFFYADTDAGLRGIIFLGFVSSLFFKENLLGSFLKLMLVNSLFFFMLSLLIAYLGWAAIDFMDKGGPESLFFILRSDDFSLVNVIFYSYGYIAGIIPLGIYERLRKKQKINSLGINLQEKL